MTLEGDEVGGVLGMPRPQTGMPSDEALDIICDGMILQQSSSLWMTWEGDEVGGVLGMPRPQTGMPSDEVLDGLCLCDVFIGKVQPVNICDVIISLISLSGSECSCATIFIGYYFCGGHWNVLNISC